MQTLNFKDKEGQTAGADACALIKRARIRPANFSNTGTSATARVLLANELRGAIERREIEVYYQPIVALADGKLAGLEALARWRHAGRGILASSEFIALAEQTHIVHEIGGWVLSEACRQLAEWRELLPASHTPFHVSVNLSFAQLVRPGFVKRIARMLEAARLPPQYLNLEIKESAISRGAGLAAVMLTQLRALGVRLAIDDFGKGFSSPHQLRCLAFDTLKIDRSIVGRLGEDVRAVRSAVALASNLGMTVVAGGVETDAQRERLGALGCAHAQGFLYAKPSDAETTLGLVRKSFPSSYARSDHDRSLARLTQIFTA